MQVGLKSKVSLLSMYCLMIVGLTGCGASNDSEVGLIESIKAELDATRQERQRMQGQLDTLSETMSKLSETVNKLNDDTANEKTEVAQKAIELQIATLQQEVAALKISLASKLRESATDGSKARETKAASPVTGSKEYYVKALASGQRKAALAGLGAEMQLRATIMHSDLAKRVENEDDPRIPIQQLRFSDKDTVFMIREFYPEFVGE